MSHNDDGQDTAGAGTPSTLAQAVTRSATNAPNGLRIVDSSDLLAGQTSLLIQHLGELYRLQTTRQGKLILTK